MRDLDDNIDFVGVYHNHETKIEEDFRQDLKSYFDENLVVEESSSILLQRRLYGPIHYAMEKHDDVIRYTFAINDHAILLLSTNSDANSDLTISRVLDYLKHLE